MAIAYKYNNSNIVQRLNKKLTTKVWTAKKNKAIMSQQHSKLLGSCILIRRCAWMAACQQDPRSSWVSEPSWYRNMMTVKASLTPANGAINNKTRWVGRGGVRVIWEQHMHFPVGCGGRQGCREARYGVTLLESVIWHLLSVRVCQRARQGFWGHRRFLLSPSLWVLSKRCDLQGTESQWAAWSSAEVVCFEQKSVLLLHIGRGKPTHLRSNKHNTIHIRATNYANINLHICYFHMSIS